MGIVFLAPFYFVHFVAQTSQKHCIVAVWQFFFARERKYFSLLKNITILNFRYIFFKCVATYQQWNPGLRPWYFTSWAKYIALKNTNPKLTKNLVFLVQIFLFFWQIVKISSIILHKIAQDFLLCIVEFLFRKQYADKMASCLANREFKIDQKLCFFLVRIFLFFFWQIINISFWHWLHLNWAL